MIKLHTPEQLGISNFPISPQSYVRSFEAAMAKCPGRLVSVFPVTIGGTNQLFLAVEYPKANSGTRNQKPEPST